MRDTNLFRTTLALCLLAAGCTTDFNRFDLQEQDTDDALDGDQSGDGDDSRGGDGGGDGDRSGEGDGDGDDQKVVDKPDPADPGDGDGADCATDADCESGLTCDSGDCRFVPPARIPSAIVQTAGGGHMTGGGHSLRLRVGAPAPMGKMAGGGNTLTLGPLSGRADNR